MPIGKNVAPLAVALVATNMNAQARIANLRVGG